MTSDAWSAEERRAWIVAAYARRFAMLARRADLDSDVQAERAQAALEPETLHLFDVASAVGASELDRLCGQAVLLLSEAAHRDVALLLDLLGGLAPERVVAIYFALPLSRRWVVLQNPLWAFWVREIEPDYAAAEERLNDLLDSTPTSEIGYDLARLSVVPLGA